VGLEELIVQRVSSGLLACGKLAVFAEFGVEGEGAAVGVEEG
jgi:hypothetical protein